MKITISIKDPDAVWEAAKATYKDVEDDSEREQLEEQLREDIGEFFEFGEYLKVVYDTEDRTLLVEQP